jgi:hypothetical protein
LKTEAPAKAELCNSNPAWKTIKSGMDAQSKQIPMFNACVERYPILLPKSPQRTIDLSAILPLRDACLKAPQANPQMNALTLANALKPQGG